MNKNLIILTFGRLSQMLIMFFTYRVLSTILSVSDMGIYYFLLSISAAFGLIFANPIGMYTNRVLHSWQSSQVLFKNLKIVLLTLLAGSFLTIPFLFLFQNKISLDGQSLSFLISVLVFYVFSTTFNGTVVPSLNLLGHTRAFVIWTFLTNALGLAFSYLLVTRVSNNPLYWLIGQAAAFTFSAAISLIILYISEKSDVSDDQDSRTLNKRLHKVLKFGLPIALTNIAVWGLSQSFRFFYKENIDLTILGEMAFGLGLASSLSVAVEYLLQQIHLPEFYKEINRPEADKSQAWNHFFNNLVPSYIYLMFFIIGLSPFIMRVLADVKFKNSHTYLALGAGVEVLRMLGNIFTMGTQSEMKTHKAIGPYITGGIITLSGVLYICRHPEYVGLTPFALMAGYLASLIYLRTNVGEIISVKIDYAYLVKCLVSAFIFLTALFLHHFSQNLFYSIGILGVYGIALAALMYHSYLKGKQS